MSFVSSHRMSKPRVGLQVLIFAGSLASTAALGILAVLSIAQPMLALIPAGLLAALYWISRQKSASRGSSVPGSAISRMSGA